MKLLIQSFILLVGTGFLLSPAHAEDKESLKQKCIVQLDIADKELEAAKADTLSDAGSFTRITVILTDGALAKQFGSYTKCIRKATRARELLKPYKKQTKAN
ncbi:MAG: hypothetical protein OEZ10_08525 [Gammaproteobacteria bacterium]|nr:hypothetical protein [Gammaproteobacteria bacterium]